MRRFELKEGSSSKFWQIDLQGESFTVGTTGQTQLKNWPSPDKAQAEHDKPIKEKTGKGYVAVGAIDPILFSQLVRDAMLVAEGY